MTVRIWRIPDRYPNKQLGTFQDPSSGSDDDLRFTNCERIESESELVFDFRESQLDKLRALGCLWTDMRTPLVNGDIASVLKKCAALDYQLMRSRVLTAGESTTEFSFLNVLGACECLDYERSRVAYWESGHVKSIKTLRLNDESCMGVRHLARLAPYKGYILVSEKLFEGLKNLKFSGLHFEIDSDGDGFR